MKVLSVVIPAYNVEKYLDRCLRSLLLDEIIEDIEIIIVNDGSKDSTLEIANRYQKQYTNAIIVIDKENGGHGSTINAGLKIASGKYFKVVDGDDWVNVEDFSQFVKELKNQDVDLIITDYQRELAYSKIEIICNYDSKILEYGKEYNFNDFDLKKLGLEYFYMATSTYKTEVLKRANFELDEKTFYVDMEFNLFPITTVSTFKYLKYNIYRYFFGREDQSMNVDTMVRNRSHHERVLRRLLKFYTQTEVSKNKKEYMAKILSLMLNTHYMIYCSFSDELNKQKEEIRKFDNDLKQIAPDLYELTNDYAYIRWNRRVNFRFSYKHWLTRLVNIYEKKVLLRNQDIA